MHVRTLEPQVLLVSQAVRAPLDDPDLVVEAFDEAKRDLVVRVTVRGDAVPVTLPDQVYFNQPLPLPKAA